MTGVFPRNAYEFDPNSYGPGGLLDRLQALLPQSQQDLDFATSPNVGSEFEPATYGAPQGGLLGRLLALQAEQSRYRPTPTENEQAPFTPKDPNFRQLSRAPSSGSVSTPAAGEPPEPAAPLSEADQAQRAREVAAARLSRGVSSPNRAAEFPHSQVLNLINGAGRAFANGVPVVGAFNNNIDARLGAGLAPVLNPFLSPENRLSEPSLRGRYEHALRTQNDIDARFAKENPVISGLANFAGGMTLLGPLGPIAQAPIGARMLGLTEGALPEMMLRGALTRAGIWGMDAAARGNTDRSLILPMIAGALGPVGDRAWSGWKALMNVGRYLHSPA